jgi:anti-sigma regulatory factor (Ser/Thr protein kinase)
VIARRSFGLDPTSVAESRRFVGDTLEDLPEEVRESAELMMSELATNAVVHAATGFEVCIERTDTLFRVDVTDVGRGEPHLRSPRVSDAHGRGLQIVKQLSDEWGIIDNANHSSKTVWYAVRLSPTSESVREDPISEGRPRKRTGNRSGRIVGRRARSREARPDQTDDGGPRAHRSDALTMQL